MSGIKDYKSLLEALPFQIRPKQVLDSKGNILATVTSSKGMTPVNPHIRGAAVVVGKNGHLAWDHGFRKFIHEYGYKIHLALNPDGKLYFQNQIIIDLRESLGSVSGYFNHMPMRNREYDVIGNTTLLTSDILKRYLEKIETGSMN